MIEVRDLFAGPGGWDVAARDLGLDPLGIEKDPAAVATRKAAGLRTLAADVRTIVPSDLGRVEILIASPPCPDWSESNRRGENAGRGIDADGGALVLEVLRFAEALRPRVILCEQVPKVLPVWRDFALRLRYLGYGAGAWIVNAAYQRPATTVTSAGRIPAPGYRHPGERQFAAGSVRLTVEQAARLQGFPDGYPWQAPGAHLQVGNAVPPPLARALLETFLRPTPAGDR